MQSKRAYCKKCLRPERACICACAKSVQSDIEVLVLQHAGEVRHIKGSARLLHLCLPNSRLIELDDIDSTMLSKLLETGDKHNILLYPDADFLPPSIVTLQEAMPSTLRLILIDATWRHSRQVLLKYPILQTLPRLVLQDTPTSRYEIRHAQKTHQLSTLEACTYGLMQLDKSQASYSDLLLAFESLNTLQIDFGVNKLRREMKPS